MTPSSSFSSSIQFCDLPIEIRIYIWELSIPGPRIINLNFIDPQRNTELPTPDSSGLSRYKPTNWVLKSNTTIPTVLHVSGESRDVARKFYRPAFQVGSRGSPPHPPYTWFDFDRDIFYTTGNCSGANGPVDVLPLSEISQIKNLAIDYALTRNAELLASFLIRFSSVSCVFIVRNFAYHKMLGVKYADIEGRDLTFWGVPGEDDIHVEGAFEMFTSQGRAQHVQGPINSEGLAPEVTNIPRFASLRERLKSKDLEPFCSHPSDQETLILQLRFQRLQSSNLKGILHLAQLPRIEYKAMMSSKMKKELQRAREDYDTRTNQDEATTGS